MLQFTSTLSAAIGFAVIRKAWYSLVGVLAVTVLIAGGVTAQAAPSNTPGEFEIAAQPLDSALKTFAEQSQMQLMYSPEAVKNLTTKGVRGRHTPERALEILLEDSGLIYKYTDDETVIVRKVEESMLRSRNPAVSEVAQVESVSPAAATAVPTVVITVSNAGAARDAATVTLTAPNGRIETARDDDRDGVIVIAAGAGPGLYRVTVTVDGRSETRTVTVPRQGRVSVAFDLAGAQDYVGIEEVTVTGTKRGVQRLQDVPMTITAIPEGALEAMGADDFVDFARSVPGLTFQDQGPGDKFYIIRGLQSKGKATTGVYLDEAVITSSTQTDGDGGGRQPDIKLFDLERVEVLRGPQGTLYGAGSMGGTIRFITNKPDPTRTAGKIDVTGSTTRFGGENLQLNGMLNFPIVRDKLAIRLVGWIRDESGFIDNVRLGNKNVNTENTEGGRILLRLFASEDLTLTASVVFQNLKTGGRQSYFPQDGDLKQSANAVLPWKEDLQIYNFTADYDFGFADFVATTSWFERDLVLTFDTTPILAFLGVPNKARTSEPQTNRIWSSEARMTSKWQGPLQAVLGVFIQSQRQSFFSTVPEVGDNGLPLNPINDLFSRSTNGKLEQQAIFGEISYDITEDLTATFGGRWFHVSQTDTSALIVPFFLFGGEPGPGPTLKAKESKFTKKFALSYQASEDALIYFQAAQGFRVGGTNDTGISNVVSQFNADSLWNYEIGTKTSWFENLLIVNGTIYTIRWSDIQVSDVDPTGGFTFINNAGKAQVDGFEFEIVGRPARGLDITLTGGYQRARLTQDQPAGGGGGDEEEEEEGGVPGLKGDRMPHVPKFTGSAAIQYRHPLGQSGDWDGIARADISYVGSSRTKFRPNDPFFHIKRSYALVNFRIGVEADDWNASIFINNVFDKRADVNIVEGFADTLQIFTNRPRTAGVNIKKRF